MATLRNDTVVRSADGQTTSAIVTATNIGTYGVAANSTYYVGTTQNVFNRASGAQTLTGVSIDGNAATVSYPFNNNNALDLNSTGTTNQFSAFNVYYPSGGSYNQPIAGSQHFKILQFGRYNADDANYWRGQMAMSFYTDRMFFRKEYLSTWGSWMEFLHTGNYAGYSAFTTSLTSTVDARAPIFYDSNDTTYYIDPANGGFNLRGGTSNRVTFNSGDSGIIITNAEGISSNVRLGCAWGRPGIYNGASITVGAETQIDFVIANFVKAYIDSASNLFANGSIRSPIFYDSNNTAYYLDPANTGTSLLVAGNVGIGTTSPSAKLHVYNGSSHFEATSTGTAVLSSGLYALQIGPLHDRLATAGTYYGGIAFNHLLNFGGGTTYNVAPQAWIGTRLQDSAGSERDYLVFATKSGTGTSGTGNDIPVERMCIDYTGAVGIGTTSPATLLHVDTAGADARIRVSAGTNTVQGGMIANTNGLVYAGSITNHGFSLRTNDTDRVRIDTSGNVGIGTTTPSQKLDVSGSINASTYVYAGVFYDNDNTVYYTNPSGTSNLVGLTVANTITGSISGNAATVTTNANLTGHITSVGNATSLGSFTSAQLLAALTDETGTGANVFATSPTLVSPILGTPTSGNLANCTFPTLNQNTTGSSASCTGNSATVTNGVYTTGAQTIAGVKTFSDNLIANAKLEVSGTSGDSLPTFKIISTTAPNTFNYAGTILNSSLGASRNYVLFIGKASSTKNAAYIGYNHSGTDGSDTNFLTLGHYASDNLLNILGNGNVGIGTTSPSQKLHVVGTGFASSDFRAPIFYDSNDTAYYVDPNSNSILLDVEARGGINLRRDLSAATGISFYNTSYYNWQVYMAAAAATGCGANGNLTAPNGLTNVSSWALRSRMEAVGSYGWLWEVGSGGAGGGGATATSVMELDTGGILTLSGQVRVPIFYDRDNTAYYVDPNSTSNLLGLTVTNTITGSITGNAGGSSASCTGNAATATTTTGNAGSVTYLPNRTDSAVYQVLWGAAYTNGSGTIAYSCSPVYIQSSTGSLYANAFYDAGNTAYYIDPASTSVLNALTIAGNSTFSADSYLTFGPNSSWSRYLRIGGNGYTAPVTTTASVVTTNGNLHLDAAKAAGMAIYLNWYGGAGGTIFGNGSGTQVGAVDSAGNTSFIGTLGITGAITGASFSGAGTGLTGTAASLTIGGYANYISAQTNPNGLFNAGLTRPKGASYTTTATTVTGAIKIKMPPGTPVHGMWKMTIKVYEYGSRGNGYTIECGCHLYPSTAYNRYQYIISADPNMALTIRYGTDGTSGCIWIGENATTWSYPQIHVTEFSNGYNNPGGVDWNAGTWGVTIGTIDNSVAVDGPYTAGLSAASTSNSISGFNNPTTAATANTIVYRDGSGHITGNYIFGSYLNSSDEISTGTITYIMAKFGDNYHRSATAAKVATFISGQTMNIAGSSTSCSGNAATVTTNANLTGHITSVGNATSLGSFTSAQLLAALTDETGTGANVFATSPTLVSPLLGTPTSGNLANCTFPTLNQNTTGSSASCTGNAATATILQTARTIGGVSFNGSAAIDLPGVNTGGNQNTSGSSASCTGNAATVTNGMYLSGDQFISGAKYFTSNKGAASTVGANATYSLEAYSSDAGAAGMSFHRGGYYAVNMGLDPDNVLRIGGWSASANRLQLDMSGNLTIAAGMYATGFYDTNNTALYCDPTGTSLFTGLTVTNTITGSITGNAGGSSASCTGNSATATILQTARNINGTSFNGSAAITTATWGTARTITIGSTGKSVDGSANVSWSLAELGAAATNQTMFIGTTSVAINRASASQTLTGVSIDGNSATTTLATKATRANGNFYIDDNYGNTVVGAYNAARYQGVFAMGDSYKLLADGTTTGNLYGIAWSHPNAGGAAGNLSDHGALILLNGGYAAAISSSIRCTADMRTPIYYDSNDTAYYVNPNSTSNLYIVTVASNVTAANYYTGGWFRNNASGNGLYNEATGQHFYSDDVSYWNVASSSSAQGIRLRTGGHAGTVRGYFYADTANDVGLLNNAGSWRVRVVGGDYTLIDGSSIRAQIFYDSNDTGYYTDPAGTSILNVVRANSYVQKSASQSLSGTVGCTIDVAAAGIHVLTLAASTTISSFTYNYRAPNPSVNTIMLVIKYGGTASITWTNVLWANGVTPTTTGVSGYADVYMLTSYQGTTGVWIGTVVAQGLVSTSL